MVKSNNKIKIIVSAVAAAIIVVIAIILLCVLPNKNPMQSYAQAINTEESIEQINNPDQGFYHPIPTRITESGATYNKNIVTSATQLYHLRIDISAFSQAQNGEADKLLTPAALAGLEELLTYLKQNNKNAVVRFAYDPNFGGAKNKEPAQEFIIEHIKQVCPILNNFGATVTAIEAGLIGPWGEMHSSTIANAEHINPIIETFLTNTNNLPILVRTPKMIYNYLGITINDLETYKIDPSSKAYWLGLYNDGYLGSENDLGTYINREKEVAFLSKLNTHLPYGGEVVIPTSELHNIENCLPEMNELGLSYLNVEWNYEVINKWKSSTYTAECGSDEKYYGQTAFTYIQNHMGYRFVLTESVFEYSNKFDKLNIKLKLNNVGFGNLTKTKQAKLIFVNENNQIAFQTQVGNFSGNSQENFSAAINLENGTYQVYLCVYGEEVAGAPTYAVRFANTDIFDSNLQANKIGEIKVQK